MDCIYSQRDIIFSRFLYPISAENQGYLASGWCWRRYFLNPTHARPITASSQDKSTTIWAIHGALVCLVSSYLTVYRWDSCPIHAIIQHNLEYIKFLYFFLRAWDSICCKTAVLNSAHPRPITATCLSPYIRCKWVPKSGHLVTFPLLQREVSCTLLDSK